jgi:hypothetical protein
MNLLRVTPGSAVERQHDLDANTSGLATLTQLPGTRGLPKVKVNTDAAKGFCHFRVVAVGTYTGRKRMQGRLVLGKPCVGKACAREIRTHPL